MFDSIFDGLGDAFSNVTSTVGDAVKDLPFAGSDFLQNLTSNIGSTTPNFDFGSLSTVGDSVNNLPFAGSNFLASLDQSSPMGNMFSGVESGANSLANLFGGGGSMGKNIVGLGLGAYGALNARNNLKKTEAMYRPYADSYNNNLNRLNALMANPNLIKQNPAYQAALKASEEAIKRRASAGGFLGSGNLLDQLSKNAQDNAMQWYNQEANRLQGLATPNPALLAATNSARSARNQANINLGTSLAKMFGL